MATKYTREGEIRNETNVRKTPWVRQGPIGHPISRKQWLFFLFFGIMVIGVLAQIAQKLSRIARDPFSSAHRGVGIVVDRRPPGTGSDGLGVITLEVELEDGRTLRAQHEVPGAYWEGLVPGSKVAVIYKTNKDQSEIQILECGMVALSDDIR